MFVKRTMEKIINFTNRLQVTEQTKEIKKKKKKKKIDTLHSNENHQLPGTKSNHY